MANLGDLKLDARFLTNAPSTEYADADLLRNLNSRYDDVITYIWRNQSGWHFDDSNNTTLPEATTDLIAGTNNYPLPTDARELLQVHIKNPDGHFIRIDRVQTEDTPTWAMEDAFPRDYQLRGRSIILRPAPSATTVTTTAGLKVLVSRSVTPLATDTDEPGFDREFHRLLSIGASIDWCIASEIPKKKLELEGEWIKLMAKLVEFYANRDKTITYKIRPKRENYAS